jgi:hypothetical protein
MSKIEKIKRIILIAIGFGLATYLIMSGSAMLEQKGSSSQQEKSNVKNNAQ